MATQAAHAAMDEPAAAACCARMPQGAPLRHVSGAGSTRLPQGPACSRSAAGIRQTLVF